MSKDWGKREYSPREVSATVEMEFMARFAKSRSPWGQSAEMDALIKTAQTDSPGKDRTFLGVCVQRCTPGKAIQLLAPEDASKELVELVAQTLHPDEGPWGWDENATIEHVDGGWLVTLRRI